MKRSVRLSSLLLALLLLLALCACGAKQPVNEAPTAAEPEQTENAEEKSAKTEVPAEATASEGAAESEAPEKEEESPLEPQMARTITEVNARTAPSLNAESPRTIPAHTQVEVLEESGDFSKIQLDGETYYVASDYLRIYEDGKNGYLVVVDAGHQREGNYDTEPIGPGSDEMKIKVSSGTRGSTTGIPEYELTLQLSLKLQSELEARGYEVIMTRTENDVDIGNIDRANIANDAGADAFVRVHANGSEDSSVSGALTICQTPENPYNGDLYDICHQLSADVLDGLVAATGCKKGPVWETDTMCGINWCRVPVTIVEVGYMTNPEEDTLLSTDAYQDKVVQGIADGIDKFLMGET